MSGTGERYDVVIVGGGPAGLTLALALTRFLSGARVALVERRVLAPPPDTRATAIAAGVRRVFAALGVWEGMAEAAEPVRALRITDSGRGDMSRPVFLDFAGEVVPGEPFAHMVPNGVMARVLLGALGPDISILAPAEVASFSGDGALARVGLSDGRVLLAPLVVGADGAQSGLRAMAGISTTGRDYERSGIVATIGHEFPHEGAAYEHFRPAGPFASLPLPGDRSSLVWTETRSEAERLLALAPEALAREIEAAMGSTLGRVTLESPVMAFPLRLQLARTFIAPRLALVGDAAHVIHPIAGQGLNLGLKDVAALAEVAIDALRLGLDPGGPDALTRYQRWRRFDTARMAMVTDAMNALFSNENDALRAARDFGLGLVERAGPLKSALIRTAAGIGRGGPKLLSGQGI